MADAAKARLQDVLHKHLPWNKHQRFYMPEEEQAL
jgi:hypothetical protein